MSIFSGEAQTMLAVYRRSEPSRTPSVNFIEATESRVIATSGGEVVLPEDTTSPWVLPRSAREAELVRRMGMMSTRLEDWGYKVSTGPLVWNRYKEQLRSRAGRGAIPIIWAEAVGADGTFTIRSARRNHLPYFQVEAPDEWLRVKRGCVLLQRTTAKEQPRRLVAAELPQSVVDEFGSVTVENHLNMIVPIVACPPVSTAAVAAFLNSSVADRAFRCISGSVAVSAYELQSLALPDAESMRPLDQVLRGPCSRGDIDGVCEAIYHGRSE